MDSIHKFEDLDFHISRIKRDMINILVGTNNFEDMNELDNRNMKDLFVFLDDIESKWKGEIIKIVSHCSPVQVGKDKTNLFLLCSTKCGVFLNLGKIKSVDVFSKVVTFVYGGKFIYSGTEPISRDCIYRISKELNADHREIGFVDEILVF